ncbi:Ig-like domain-containing protein [Vibrio penaeicida]|uniref:PKD domain-containing protein n=1 Tax=Vibrio penaeicida TaxID=104609 RepID=UPI002732D7BD|nr:Ig-like domain-containing protein [Vibrio penaeicida]MDP2575019.1 Ig-like domain-containing protein [Vibrio penaeicida]
MNNKYTWTLLALSLPALVACGGGSSSNSSNDNTVKPPVVTPAPAKKPQINAKMNDTVRLNGLDIFAKSTAQTAQKNALNSTLADTANTQPFTWVISKKPAGSNSAIKNANALVTSFQPDLAGDYTIQLTATNPAATIEKHYQVTDAAENAAPNVFPTESVMTGIDTNITLSANAVDPDNNDLTYQWTVANKPSNATVTLTDETTENASFSANAAGEYELSIAVSDSKETVKRVVTVKIDESVVPYTPETSIYLERTNAFTQENVKPINNLNFATLELNKKVKLDASSNTDRDGTNFQYQWAVVSKPIASSGTITLDSAQIAEFTPDVTGDYVFSVTVSEGNKQRAIEYVGITAVEADLSITGPIKAVNSTGTNYNYENSFYLPMSDERIQTINGVPTIAVSKNGESTGYIKVDTITITPSATDIFVYDFTSLFFPPPITGIKIEGVNKNQLISMGESIELDIYMDISTPLNDIKEIAIDFSGNSTSLFSVYYAFTE